MLICTVFARGFSILTEKVILNLISKDFKFNGTTDNVKAYKNRADDKHKTTTTDFFVKNTLPIN